jgi:hypothetical protein
VNHIPISIFATALHRNLRCNTRSATGDDCRNVRENQQGPNKYERNSN